MIEVAYCRTLARYNEWMNRRLYEICAGLPDAERRRDRGAFFRSIHGTLDHLVYADLAFLSRFTGDPPEVPPLGVVLFPDFDELSRTRMSLDQRLLSWSESLSESWLGQRAVASTPWPIV